MKILHLMLSCFYIDNYSYQENLLPKYHKKMGLDVEVIASLFTFDKDGKGIWLENEKRYVNEYGIPVTRLRFKHFPMAKELRIYDKFNEILEKSNPDIIFMHGISFWDANVIVKYKKEHPNIKIYADNHTDFGNSAKNWLSKNILHKMLWRYCAKKLEPWVEQFYGVLPARVDFLTDVYKVKKDKVKLLVMGADDDAITQTVSEDGRVKIREKFKIGCGDILLMTAGKIDCNKPQVMNLMHAVRNMNRNDVKLVVFGVVDPALKEQFEENIDGDRVIYAGWLKAEDTYRYFDSADLLVFPGLHSVYWEQAVGCGCACLFNRIPGFTHIDLGGNCEFIEDNSTDGIQKKLDEILKHPDRINVMREKAQEKGKKVFRYSQIAKISIGGGARN